MCLQRKLELNHPGQLLFADDLMVVNETVEEELERRRADIENKGKYFTKFIQTLSASNVGGGGGYRHVNYQSKNYYNHNNLQRQVVYYCR